MELRSHRTVASLGQHAWDSLWRPADTPMLRYQFLHGLERHGCVGGDSGWLPHHLSLHEDDGTLIAAAPAYVKFNSEGEFVFDHGWADAAEGAGLHYYPKLVLAVPFTPATGARVLIAPGRDRAAVLRLFARALRQLLEADFGAHSLHALFVDEELEAPFLEAGFALRLGVQFQYHRGAQQSFEDYLASMPSKRRTQIRSERKRLAAHGIQVRTLRAEELSPQWAAQMHALYSRTVDKFAWSRRYLTLPFFEHLARECAEDQHWVVAERDGVLLGGALNYRGHDRLYGRYWGCVDEQPLLHFATCYYHGVEECFRLGLAHFEPGAGGEHKRARGFSPTLTRSLHKMGEPRLDAAVRDFLRRERAAVQRLIESPDAEP